VTGGAAEGRPSSGVSTPRPADRNAPSRSVICVISDNRQLPAQAKEGIRLVIRGVINFDKSEGGLNRYAAPTRVFSRGSVRTGAIELRGGRGWWQGVIRRRRLVQQAVGTYGQWGAVL
jgi:hypothetical protein